LKSITMCDKKCSRLTALMRSSSRILGTGVWLIAIILCSADCMAETLTGVIRDAVSGTPLGGTSVYLVKGKQGGYAASDGTFSISGVSAATDSLVCRLIGYHESRVPVTIPGSVTIRMTEEPVVLETVEVSARRPDEVPLNERTSSSVTVIEREEIPERSITLDDVLDSQVGIDIRTFGGAGSRSDISVRGSTTEQVAVYLDGIPLNAGGSGVSGLASIPVSQVKNIEVYRGSSPGSFGAGAIGGVVNITTIPSEAETDLSTSASIGSFGTNHETVAAQFGLGVKNRFLVSFDRRASENDFRYFDDRGTYINTADDGWEIRKNADIETLQLNGGWSRKMTDSRRLRTSLLYRTTDQGISGLGRSPAFDARFSLNDILWQTTYETGGWLTAQSWLSHEDRGFYDPSDEVGRMGPQDTDTDIDIQGVQTQINKVFGGTLAHIRFDLRRETYETSDSFHSDISLPSQRFFYSAGYEHEIVLANQTLWLQPRINYTRIDDKIQDVSLVAGALADSLRSKTRTIGNAALGVRCNLNETLTVRANAGIYSREPDFSELFGDTGDVVGNTELEEEKSTNYDAGFHWADSWFPGKVDFSLYHRNTIDLIQQRSYGDYLKAENIGKAQIDGAELLVNGDFTFRNVFYRISAAYQRGLNKSDATAFRKKRYYNKFLPYHPEWMIDGVLRTDLTHHSRLSWLVSYESSCYRGPSNLPDEMIDARLLQNLQLDIAVMKNMGITGEIENLTDESYIDRWGYPKPGRAYYLSMRWLFDIDKSK
jgi:outer membrane cobalamin receptor